MTTIRSDEALAHRLLTEGTVLAEHDGTDAERQFHGAAADYGRPWLNLEEKLIALDGAVYVVQAPEYVEGPLTRRPGRHDIGRLP